MTAEAETGPGGSGSLRAGLIQDQAQAGVLSRPSQYRAYPRQGEINAQEIIHGAGLHQQPRFPATHGLFGDAQMFGQFLRKKRLRVAGLQDLLPG